MDEAAARKEIEEVIERETTAWNTKDVELLLSVFHPDMVWPWPRTAASHDPMDWVITQGRYNRERWKIGWQALFDTRTLVRNRRETKKIQLSDELDGAFAVVDVDTLWRGRDGKDFLWKGRACKVYTKMDSEWKMTMQTGLLEYGSK